MSERIILKGNSKLLKPIITNIMALHQLIEQKDVGTILAYSNDNESVKRVGKPKVTLYFLEDTNFNKKAAPNKIAEGRRRQEGLIRFRLMNETSQSFSKANAEALGNRIKQVFGSNGGFVWNKGKTLYSYTDYENGYQFQLLCRSETEAKRIITAVLSLQTHTPDWLNFNTVKNDNEASKYPETPPNQIVMGEAIETPRRRPVVDVRFQYAYIKLSGVQNHLHLYDRRNRLPNTLVN